MPRHRITHWLGAPIAALALLASCTPFPQGRPTPGEHPSDHLFTTGPYILLGEPGQAFIALKADLTAPPIVEWQAETEGRTRSDSVGAIRRDDLWVATLTGLPIGPKILYRVRSRIGTTKEHSFRAGAAENAPVRFAVFGDTRDGHVVHRAVVEAIANERTEFVIHTGDMVGRGGLRPLWDLFFQIERPLLVDRPILPAIGNHDEGNQGYFRHYFLHDLWAKGQRYYVHDWGRLRVVVLDGGVECRDGCAQYAFAQRALHEGAQRGMLLVMVLHYPPYSSGWHGSTTSIQAPITELAARNGVELVIAGHDHNYERTTPIRGTTYVVSGSAGAPIRWVEPQWFTASARTEPHYVLVDVDGDRLALRAVNLTGNNFDTATIGPNPPRPDAIGDAGGPLRAPPRPFLGRPHGAGMIPFEGFAGALFESQRIGGSGSRAPAISGRE